MSAPPEEEELREALASVLLKDGNDDEGVVDGIDGKYALLQYLLVPIKLNIHIILSLCNK